MSIITSELNYQRNSHRVKLPMLVEINGKVYHSHDWSVNGLGLLAFEQKLEPDETLVAHCVLPMTESSIRLQVEICFKGTHGDISGFSFIDLSDRNKRVFRHYIELAIDGRLDNLEDLVSIVTAPAINSPINEALTLSDIEIDSLSHKFRSRSRLAMGAGLIFVLLMAATLLYNTVYRVQATGLIAGNISRVTANTSGIIQAVYVEPDAYTKAGTRLFTVENPQQQLTLQSLRAKLRERKSQLSSLQKLATQDTSPALLNSLEAKLNRNKRDFEQAKALYKQHIVSFKDLKYLESQLNLSQIAYNREVKNSLTQNLAVRKQINELSIEIKSLTEQEAIVRSAGASQTVHSLHDGKVFQIEHAAGSYVGSKDVVMLLEKNEQPVVLIRLLHNDALKVRLGMPAKIYVPIDDREYDAKISAIGHTAINSASTDSMEASLDETLIKLEFDNQDLRFPANARVKVWIRTF